MKKTLFLALVGWSLAACGPVAFTGSSFDAKSKALDDGSVEAETVGSPQGGAGTGAVGLPSGIDPALINLPGSTRMCGCVCGSTQSFSLSDVLKLKANGQNNVGTNNGQSNRGNGNGNGNVGNGNGNNNSGNGNGNFNCGNNNGNGNGGNNNGNGNGGNNNGNSNGSDGNGNGFATDGNGNGVGGQGASCQPCEDEKF